MHKQADNDLRQRFLEQFDVWEEARPFMSLMVTDIEMRLVDEMASQKWTAVALAPRLGLSEEEAASLLETCFGRGVVNRSEDDGQVVYQPADFYTRLDFFIKFENWDDIPEAGRKAIDRRYLGEFIRKHRDNVARLMRGEQLEQRIPNDAVLLLHEAEEMIENATDIILLPCDCRRAGQNCTRPTEVCIWMDRMAREALERGHGTRISRAEARDVLRNAHRKGLMHTSDIEWRQRGLSAICNCCACDCYPFRAGIALGSKDVWPQKRYEAYHFSEKCTHCGACVKRCHFGAFFHAGEGEANIIEVEGKRLRRVQYDAHKCWGCGLCATTCPTTAIVMQPWSGSS